MFFQQTPVNIDQNTGTPFSGDFYAGRAMTIGILTNPKSGGNKKGIGKIRAFLEQHPEIISAEAVTPLEVNAVLACFAEQNVDLLVINGGDGTIQAVLTAIFGRSIFQRHPVLALLEAGTTSMLSRDAGVRGKPPLALARILDWSSDTGRNWRHIHERPVLKVTQESDPGELCGMFFGAGAIPFGIELCHTRMNPGGIRGELLPGLIIARFIISVLTGSDKFVPVTDLVTCIDETVKWQTPCLCVMVSTLERLFLGLHPFWGDESAPLHFTALRTKPSHMLRNLPFLMRGRRTETATPENGFFSHNARKITLDFRGRFILDGEFFEAVSPLTIESAGPAGFLRI
jgi:diacylglycerol kinase (ATP)